MAETNQEVIVVLEKHKQSGKLFNELQLLFKTFHGNHVVFSTKDNKAAGGRARKALGEIKKLVTEYRKISVEESKS